MVKNYRILTLSLIATMMTGFTVYADNKDAKCTLKCFTPGECVQTCPSAEKQPPSPPQQEWENFLAKGYISSFDAKKGVGVIAFNKQMNNITVLPFTIASVKTSIKAEDIKLGESVWVEVTYNANHQPAVESILLSEPTKKTT